MRCIKILGHKHAPSKCKNLGYSYKKLGTLRKKEEHTVCFSIKNTTFAMQRGYVNGNFFRLDVAI